MAHSLPGGDLHIWSEGAKEPREVLMVSAGLHWMSSTGVLGVVWSSPVGVLEAVADSKPLVAMAADGSCQSTEQK
jgi:hypothetical protein